MTTFSYLDATIKDLQNLRDSFVAFSALVCADPHHVPGSVREPVACDVSIVGQASYDRALKELNLCYGKAYKAVLHYGPLLPVVTATGSWQDVNPITGWVNVWDRDAVFTVGDVVNAIEQAIGNVAGDREKLQHKKHTRRGFLQWSHLERVMGEEKQGPSVLLEVVFIAPASFIVGSGLWLLVTEMFTR